jgi:uncharacterized protein YprB with RNaseH-like and TPR domain
MANKWTEQELAVLHDLGDEKGLAAYHAFSARTNYSKSFDAFEVKRRRILGSSKELSNKPASELSPSTVTREAVEVPVTKSYVGLTVAYWDLETTFSTQPLVLYGAIADQFGDVQEFRKGKDITDDKELVKNIAEALSKFDVWVTWNGKLFDVPVLNGRLRFHGLPPLPLVKHIDAMYYATGGSMRIGRRSLASVSEYFDVPNRKTPLTVRTWDKAMAGDEKAYNEIAEHGAADVLVTRDVFNVLKTQVANIHR